MKFNCSLLEPRQLLNHAMHVRNWNQMQNAADSGGGGGVFFQCEEYACMLRIISLRANFSQNMKYWYEIRDVLVPIFHAQRGISTNFSLCEICEV